MESPEYSSDPAVWAPVCIFRILEVYPFGFMSPNLSISRLDGSGIQLDRADIGPSAMAVSSGRRRSHPQRSSLYGAKAAHSCSPCSSGTLVPAAPPRAISPAVSRARGTPAQGRPCPVLNLRCPCTGTHSAGPLPFPPDGPPARASRFLRWRCPKARLSFLVSPSRCQPSPLESTPSEEWYQNFEEQASLRS